MRKNFYTRLFYFITPVVLLVAFTVFYSIHMKQERIVEAERQHQAEIAAQKKAEEQRQLEAKLDSEAKAIKAAKAKAEADKEAKEEAARQAKFDDLHKRLDATTTDYNRLAKTVDELNQQIKETRTKRMATEDAVYALDRKLVEMRSDKNTADLETQRLIGSIQDRFDKTWKDALMPKPPEVPAR